MRRIVLFGLLLAVSARAQGQNPIDPIDIVNRLVNSYVRTHAMDGPSGPAPTPTPLPFKEPKPLEVQPDWSSVDAIVTALYASVSHGPDSEPNWTRLRNLFLPEAMVVPPKAPDAETFTVLDVEKFEARVRRYIAGRRERHERLGFTEREIARRERCFGHVCQVFSAYETLYAPHDPQPFARGVHSIQLVDDGRRWWIAALVWDVERPDRPIPPDLRPTEIPSRPGS